MFRLRVIASWLLALFVVAGIVAAAANDLGQLSDVERLRYELLVVRSQLHAALTERDACRVQLAPIRVRADGDALKAAMQELKSAVEKAHPGFTFDVQAGTLAPTPLAATTEKPK